MGSNVGREVGMVNLVGDSVGRDVVGFGVRRGGVGALVGDIVIEIVSVTSNSKPIASINQPLRPNIPISPISSPGEMIT